MKQICQVCKHVRSNSDHTGYECHRYAPRIIHGSGAGWSDTKWPTVKSWESCGEFKPKESEEEKHDNSNKIKIENTG